MPCHCGATATVQLLHCFGADLNSTVCKQVITCRTCQRHESVTTQEPAHERMTWVQVAAAMLGLLLCALALGMGVER